MKNNTTSSPLATAIVNATTTLMKPRSSGEAWVVPEYYRTFWGYYRHWIPVSYEPGYVERDRDVQVETALYSATSDGELIYSAISRTLNPNSPADLAKDVTSLVARKLRDKASCRRVRRRTRRLLPAEAGTTATTSCGSTASSCFD
jgi:hypothetical protein